MNANSNIKRKKNEKWVFVPDDQHVVNRFKERRRQESRRDARRTKEFGKSW